MSVTEPTTKIEAVDLFCGVGGLTRGLLWSGITVRAGIDIDPFCKYPYEINNNVPFMEENILAMNGSDIEAMFTNEGEVRLLAGCAPCQPYSTYSQGSRRRRNDDWTLVSKFAELVSEFMPEVVTMENVPQLVKHPVFQQFMFTLKNLGYHVSYFFAYGPEYGIPQTRRRLVLFASLFGTVSIVAPTHSPDEFPTVRKTIEHLAPLQAGEVSTKDPIHRASKLSSMNLERIRASRPGGTWRDWPSELVATCHTKAKGRTYSSVYGRMEWDKPAPTITTQAHGFGNGRFGHPEQDRALSLREAALLQTFPENYEFMREEEAISFNVVGRLIGNAVPARLGQVVGDSINRHVQEVEPEKWKLILK